LRISFFLHPHLYPPPSRGRKQKGDNPSLKGEETKRR